MIRIQSKMFFFLLHLWQHSRHDAQLDNTEFTLSTPVTRKVASKKHANKENVDTESVLKNEMPFALPAPKTPLGKSQIEKQGQGISIQVPACKGMLCVTNENQEHVLLRNIVN